MTDLTIAVPGARLSADLSEGDAGSPAVVALHGLTQSRAADDVHGYFGWAPVAAADRRLLRYDARGHGRSTGTAEPDGYRWPVLAEDLLRVLDAALPGETVDAIGVSMGVGTLLHAVLREPGRFRRLVLALPPTAWATRPAQRQVYEGGARFIEERGLDAFARAAQALPPLPLLDAGGWASPPPDVTEALLPSALRGAGASDLPPEEAVRGIAQPVLLLPWADDPGHPVSTAQRLHELLPDAELHVMRTPDDLRAAGSRAAAFLA